jgi:hypothetical protein
MLSRKRRRYIVAFIVLIPIAAILFKLGEINSIFIFLVFACFPLAALLLIALRFSARCPECGGILGFSLGWPLTWDFSVSKEIKFCQRCGVSLDKEIENNKTTK